MLRLGPSRLKEFVRTVRACKTAAEERDVIAKESAAIRTAFKEADNEYRHRSVAKLLYIHMLGYNAQFGQVECVKLCASPRFADKRLGYLGIMLLLDENQEVLTLVTNSLKNDMNSPNVFVNGLACCTLGNISSAEMSRDLASEVEKLIGSQSSYVRKKACLCAVRIMRKVPELHENFVTRAMNILSERNHAVLLTGVILINELLKVNPELVPQFRKFVPDLVRLMKALSTSNNSSEHDVGGIADPFLQVNILRLMRTLGRGDAHASELMSDTLARVATNTDASKNVGNAILYETVLAIMEIESESGLRVLAINILGRFLANRDNNIRYVALNTLLKTLSKDNNAVQRHRNTVVECLQDGDISIRRRALELTFALINDSNIRVLVRELLTFLEKADKEFKPRITSEIAAAADRDAPNKRWHVDTILRVLRLAGNFVEDDILANFIRLITTSPELHAYTVNKLYHAIKEDVSQEALMHAAIWAIGEFGDVLVRGEGLDPEEAHVKISEADVLDLLESILKSPYTSTTAREYVLTALMKLSTRFSTGIDRIQALLRGMVNNVNVELQQRAAEYLAIFRFDQIRPSLLERMPPPEQREVKQGIRQGESPADAQPPQGVPAAFAAGAPAQAASPSNLLDLDLMGGDVPTPSRSAATGAAAANDLLSLLDGGAPAPSRAAPAQSFDPLADLLGGGAASAPAAPAAAAGSFVGYDKNGIRLLFAPQKDPMNPQVINVTITFLNGTPALLQNFAVQVAVPKTLKLQVQPPSTSTLPPGGNGTQLIRIANPTNEQIRLRLKVVYTANGQNIEDIDQVNNFPQL